jgi:hypothetical protein
MLNRKLSLPVALFAALSLSGVLLAPRSVSADENVTTTTRVHGDDDDASMTTKTVRRHGDHDEDSDKDVAREKARKAEHHAEKAADAAEDAKDHLE